jgi:rubrerythrin
MIQNELHDSARNSSASRRSFFTQAAVLFGAGALANKIADAQTTSNPSTAKNDIDILNYALALEHLEYAFYAVGINRYTAVDFSNRIDSTIFGTKVNASLFTYLQAIRDHEAAHVTAISNIIRQLGGTPVAACTYNFGLSDVNDFLTVAAALENTGVMAYDGAIAMISDPTVKQAAATIAMVEGRHAAYLNVLNGQIPFPQAFDTPKTQAEVLAIANQYITACPGGGPTSNPSGPIIRGLTATINTVDRDYAFDFSRSSTIDGSAVVFQFQQVSGPLAAVTGQRTSTPRAIFLGGKGQYVFELIITDGAGAVQRGLTTVNVN